MLTSTLPHLETHPDEIYVDGAWVRGTGGRLDLVNPATEESLGQVLDAAPEEVDRAVAAARQALAGWSARTHEERVAVIERALELLEPQAEMLAQVQTAQMGVPITVSRMMIGAGTPLTRAYITGARALTYEYIRQDIGTQALVRREPVGVVAAITPWNGPLATVINKTVPALLTGNSVVLKPAPETPLDGGLFAEICTEAGLPPGVLNIVTGGPATGEALVRHNDVDKVTFTGSTATGRRVGEICGPAFKRMSLELGGKSAAIILDDADLETTVPQVVAGNFFNSGQACIAITRVLVPSARYDEIVEATVSAARQWVVGDPLDEATQLGPLVSRRQLERVEGYVESGRREGAEIVLGGRRPPAMTRGFYYEPTIFTGVTNEMTIAREEIFGPVLSVIRYENETDALRIANDSQYGLHGAVFTSDLEHGLELARAIDSGSSTVNGFGLSPGTPYGGVKGSGVGREHGREGIEAFLEYRSYVIPSELADRFRTGGVPVA